MGFDSVIAEAFRGCGRDLREVKQSPQFRRTVERLTAAKNQLPPRSSLRFADRAGHLGFGRLLNPLEKLSERRVLSAAKELEPEEVGPSELEERALISVLGDTIVEAARKCSLPRKFHKWAREWREATSSKAQLKIARRVCRYLHTQLKRGQSRTMHADMLNQPRVRVLPKLYGRFSPRKEEKPNCLGKAQLLAAFLRLCGARTVSILPLESSCYAMRVLFDRASERFRQIVGKWSPPPNPKDISYVDIVRLELESASARLRYETELPSWPHMAIGVQLVGGRWAMLDPNFSGESRAPSAWKMPRITQLLEKYEPVLPGLTVLHRHEHLPELIDYGCVDRTAEVARVFHEALTARTSPWTTEEALTLIESSGVLGQIQYVNRAHTRVDQLIRKRKRRKPKPKHESFARNQRDCAVAVLLLEYLERDIYLKNSTPEDWPYERLKDLVLGGGALELLTGEALERAMKAVVPMLFSRTLKYIDVNWMHLPKSAAFHPQCEIGNTEYQLALHTLSHVAVDMDLIDPVTETLMRHGYNQFLLHNSATAIARFPESWRCRNEFAEVAASHLSELPFQLRSSAILLKEIKYA